MVLFIHGFSSSGNATKANILKDYYGHKETVISPDLPVEPDKAINLLENIIESSSDSNKMIVGSSLGGFYALMLYRKYKIPTVLINPALYPWIQLEKSVGENINIKTGETFFWKKEFLLQLKNIEDESDKNIDLKDVFLLVATDDELIDFGETITLLGKTGSLVIWENAGHQFIRFSEALELIDKFYRKSNT
jgi:uncharacterized protein